MLIRTALSWGFPLALSFLAALAGGAVAAFIVRPEASLSSRVDASPPAPIVNRDQKSDRLSVPFPASPLPLIGGL